MITKEQAAKLTTARLLAYYKKHAHAWRGKYTNSEGVILADENLGD